MDQNIGENAMSRLGTSRISGAASSAAHNLPAVPPAHSVPPISEDTVASAQPTQPNSSVSGAQSPAAPPSLGGGHALTSSSGVARGGGGLAAAHATSAAVPPQEESEMSSRWEFGFDGNLVLEMMESGTARAVQHVWAPQARVVHVPARGQQGQAEEGYEEGEGEDDDERGRDVGVALTRDSVNDEVEFDDDDEGMEDQAAEEAAVQTVRDQRRNRRLGWTHFTPEEIQSFLPPPGRTPEAAEAPSDSSPPSPPAPSAPVAPAPVVAPIVPSLGSPSASADPQDSLAAPHPRVPPVSHAPGVDPYDINEHIIQIEAVGRRAPETVPYHSDTGHRAALSDDEEPQVPRSVGRSGIGLPRFHTSGNFFGAAARSGRTDRGRPPSLPDVGSSQEGEKGGKEKKDVAKKSRG
ncbi:hypothetical protein N0V85_001251, partial [Neurospora sp. IMI 360204]